MRSVRVFVEERYGLHFHPAVFKLSKLFVALALAAHWMGCINWLVVESFGYRADSWVAPELRKKSVAVKYSWATFKALSMMLIMEFGIATPVTTKCARITTWCTVETWLALLSMWVGAIFYGILIGALAEVLSSINISGRSYQDNLQAVTEYLRVNKIPGDLHDRVQDFFYQQYGEGKIFPDDVLDCLSPQIRSEVLLSKYKRLGLDLFPIVADGGRSFQLQLVKHLHDHFVFGEDRVFEERTVGDYMYLKPESLKPNISLRLRWFGLIL